MTDASTLLRLVDKFSFFFFFFNDTATTEIYTLSLHDALPIFPRRSPRRCARTTRARRRAGGPDGDRKSTRLNSSHVEISYAVFCLKKKKKTRYKLSTLSKLNIHLTERFFRTTTVVIETID